LGVKRFDAPTMRQSQHIGFRLPSSYIEQKRLVRLLEHVAWRVC
jgi:hypothetical protein